MCRDVKFCYDTPFSQKSITLFQSMCPLSMDTAINLNDKTEFFSEYCNKIELSMRQRAQMRPLE